MADLKISQLTSATTPLAGTEVLPIVQSGTTKQVSVANLTAGRSVSVADLTASTGNIIIGTAGKGIDFSATSSGSGTMTSELFSDYEEGTWTATMKGSVTDPTTPVTATGRYTRVGRLVTISVSFDSVNTTGAAGDVTVTGIPFNNSTPFTRVSGTVGYLGNFPIVNKYVACGMDENATAVYFNDIAGIGFGASLQHSAGAGRYLRFEMTYYAA